MALWINEARNALSVASNNYAKIQRELDKYNKIFETYSRASPETQIRAASVMRQALNEYNSLKAQQEENMLKIYETQNWVNYYNKTPADVVVTPSVVQKQPIEVFQQDLPQVEIDTGTYQEEPAIVEETPVIDTSIPWSSNLAYVNTTNTQNVRNEATLNAVASTPGWRKLLNLNNQNKVQTTSYKPNIQTPKYPNTTLKEATSSWAKNSNTYWTGNTAQINTISSWVWKRFSRRQFR